MFEISAADKGDILCLTFLSFLVYHFFHKDFPSDDLQ